MNFGADVSRLLEIVTHALYSNRDVFLRELVSNAADACDKLRFEAVKHPELASPDPFRIIIHSDSKTRTLTILDNGIGMSQQELIDHLGTIAKSGTRALMDRIKTEQADNTNNLSLIGQFGVGFYASFMVADKTIVISRRTGTADTHTWESDGKNGFTIRAANEDECRLLKNNCGTAVILHIKDDASDYLIDDKIKHVVETYSNHINIPVYLNTTESDAINKASALWMRSKSAIEDDEYKSFYQSVSNSMGMDEPAMTSHWKAEGKIEYTGLLFIPTLRPWDLYDPTRRHAVKLYVRRIFIADDCNGLVYPWLRFLRGIIDSEDLPLNISREMLQDNPIIHKIRSGIAKKILADLYKLSNDDNAAFLSIWHQFGAVLKEGIYDAVEHRDDLFKIARFYTSKTEAHAPISLGDYTKQMKDGQDTIYYMSGDTIDSLQRSPHLEGFAARDIEVLLFTDTIDEFWLSTVPEFQGKKFVSITKGTVDLSKFSLKNNNTQNDDNNKDANSDSIQDLLKYLQNRLQEDVSAVRISNRLTDSPVCLVASENDADLHMQRVLKNHQQYQQRHKHVLEINDKHPLIIKLSGLIKQSGSEMVLADAADLLLDQARIIQGETLSDPSGFAKRMANFIQRGLAGELTGGLAA